MKNAAMNIFMFIHTYIHTEHTERLCFIVLHRYCIFYKLKVSGNRNTSSAGAIFPAVFAHFVSVSHFGYSHNISYF